MAGCLETWTRGTAEAVPNPQEQAFNDGFHDGTYGPVLMAYEHQNRNVEVHLNAEPCSPIGCTRPQGYLVPGQNGIIARFSLGDFTSENVQYLDASAAGPPLESALICIALFCGYL